MSVNSEPLVQFTGQVFSFNPSLKEVIDFEYWTKVIPSNSITVQ